MMNTLIKFTRNWIENKSQNRLVIFFLTSVVLSQNSFARPEYAAESHIVNCGACHVNPYGGGARTAEGKHIGSRDYKANWMSKNDLFSMDMRMQDYYSQKIQGTNSQAKGVMLMNAIPTANLPIAPEQEAKPLARMVLSYNYAPVGAGFREAYLYMRIAEPEENSYASSLLVGNFMAPFGLFTDEHRTYTKQMVAMTNRNFESGVMLNADPSHKFHYDLALTSGFANGGLGQDTKSDSWAAFANLHHQILELPLQVGLSYAIEGTSTPATQPTAASLYGVLSFDSLVENFKGNIQAEAVSAIGWNNSNFVSGQDGITYFIPSTATAWQKALTNSNSFGFSTLFNWDLSRHWTYQIKLEQFIPDTSYQGDVFNRAGTGFKWYFGSNMNVIFRYDHGDVSRPGLTNTDLGSIKAIGDTYMALLHVWI